MEKTEKSKRNNSIELLRILTMIMIVALHFTTQTHMFSFYSYSYINYNTVWMIHALNFVAVNCYILITGYFGINSKFSLKKFIKLWLEISFYSLTVYIIMLATQKIEFRKIDLLKAIFPLGMKNYWFATIYMGLYLMIPFLNNCVKNFTKKEFKKLLVLCIVLISVWPFVLPFGDTLNSGGAYSISWFIILYLILGYLKLYFDFNKIKTKYYFLSYLFFSLITFLSLMIIEKYSIKYYSNDVLYSYNSFSVLFAAISLFGFFNTIRIKNIFFNKTINFLVPLTFGVYLIHENPSFRSFLWTKIPLHKGINFIQIIIYVYIVSLILFIIFCLIDYIRKLLYTKINKTVENSKILTSLDKKYFIEDGALNDKS